MRDKIRDFELLKNKEKIFYNITPLDKIENRKSMSIKKWYTYNLIRCMRIVFMYLNKNKYNVFTYSEMTFWKVASMKKRQNIEEIQNNLNNYDREKEKYLKMCITTIKKYDDNYGLFVACVINRLFYNDLARNILEYI
jgi:hypothetical protein